MLSRTEPTNGDCLYRNREKTAEASRMRGDVARARSRLCNWMQTFACGQPRFGGKNHTADKFLDPLRKWEVAVL
jgi:predicted fused transcriptional regulator/phosphomethylpyrimidine kinase